MIKRIVYLASFIFAFSGWAGVATADIASELASGEFVAIYNTDPVSDTGNSGHPHLDIVGGTDDNGLDFAGGYLSYKTAGSLPSLTEDRLFFRYRLDGIKNKMTGAYQVFFETTGDNAVDWALQLYTTDLNSSGTLEFGRASGTDRNGVVFNPVDWTGSYADYVDFPGTPTADGSQFNGDADYFLDLSIPWEQFSSFTGIQTFSNNYKIVLTTSQNQGSLEDGDVIGTSDSGNVVFADVMAPIPEPAVASLVAGFGLSLLFGRRIFGRN